MHFVHQTTYHEVFQTTRCKNDVFSQLDPLKGELKPVPPWQLVLGRMETDWSHLLGMARQLLHHRSFLSIKKHHLCSKRHENSENTTCPTLPTLVCAKGMGINGEDSLSRKLLWRNAGGLICRACASTPPVTTRLPSVLCTSTQRIPGLSW